MEPEELEELLEHLNAAQDRRRDAGDRNPRGPGYVSASDMRRSMMDRARRDVDDRMRQHYSSSADDDLDFGPQVGTGGQGMLKGGHVSQTGEEAYDRRRRGAMDSRPSARNSFDQMFGTDRILNEFGH
jgi:hypothetical protein